MTIATILIVLTSLAGLVWASRHLMIWREKKTGFLLTEEYPGPPDVSPRVSVLLAAKDEEACIDTCVRTLLEQDYPDFEVVVCNDRSTDKTGEILQRIARSDQRVRLIDIEQLPDGWCGKNNAMQVGIAASTGRWICMIDADCRQVSKRTLSVAMQYAQDLNIDMLSVLPVLEMRGFWENVVQPVCGGVMMIWFHPDKVNNPAKPNAYANGAFMLIRREAYEAIGTHEAVKDKVNEDMHMAALAKKKGLRLMVARSSGLYMCRMYTSLHHIIRGWSRIFFGTFGTLRRLSISFLVMLFMGPMPYLMAALGLSLAAAGCGGQWLALGIAGSAVAAMQISVIYRFYKIVAARKELCWTYPIGCAIVLWSLAQALLTLRRGGKVVWRNTAYVTAGGK